MKSMTYPNRRGSKKAVALLAAAALLVGTMALPVSAMEGAPYYDEPKLQSVASLGGSGNDALLSSATTTSSVVQADDGFIAIGSSTSKDGDFKDVNTFSQNCSWIGAFSEDGKDIKWMRTITSNTPVTYWSGTGKIRLNFSAVTRLADGTYLALGIPKLVNSMGLDGSWDSLSVAATEINWTESGSGKTFTTAYTPGTVPGIAVRFNENGTILSVRNQLSGGIRFDMRKALPTSDGGYLVFGSAIPIEDAQTNGPINPDNAGSDLADAPTSDHDFKVGDTNFYVYYIEKCDADGNRQWLKYKHGQYQLNNIEQAADGGYLLTGMNAYRSKPMYTDNGNQIAYNGAMNTLLLKTDADGNDEWGSSVGGLPTSDIPGKGETFYDVTQTADGGYVAVGSSNSYTGDLAQDGKILNQGGQDFLIVKFDKDGKKLWLKDYGSSGDDKLSYISPKNDGSFIAVGELQGVDGNLNGVGASLPAGDTDVAVMRFNADGSLAWLRNAGSTKRDTLNSVLLSGNDVLLSVGSAGTDGTFEGLNKGSTDLFFLRFSDDSDGDGVPDARDMAPDDASKSLPDNAADVFDLNDTPVITRGQAGSPLVLSRNAYNFDDDGTPALFSENARLLFRNVETVMPVGVLDNLFRVAGSPESLTFDSADVTSSTSISGNKVLYASDLTVKDAAGRAVNTDDFGSDIRVTFSVPAANASAYNAAKNPTLYHIKSGGGSEAVPGASITRSENGSLAVTFNTTHFSTYAVAQTAASAAGAGTSKGNGTNNGTGKGDGTGTGGGFVIGSTGTGDGSAAGANTDKTGTAVPNPNTGDLSGFGGQTRSQKASAGLPLFALFGVFAVAGITAATIFYKKKNQI